MILDNWLAQRAETCPDRVALIAGGIQLTYEELESEATHAARRLAARGVRRGASVVIAQRAGVEYVLAMHALMKLGAVVHPLNPGLAPGELEAAIERANPALVIGEADHATMSEADLPLLGEHDLDALHCRVLTSGTSGTPRSVGLTYGNHLWSAVGRVDAEVEGGADRAPEMVPVAELDQLRLAGGAAGEDPAVWGIEVDLPDQGPVRLPALDLAFAVDLEGRADVGERGGALRLPEPRVERMQDGA